MARVRALDSCILILRTLPFLPAMHQSFLEGKQLYVSKFIKKSERENACEESNFTNLYVKYLSEDVIEDVLRERFSEYGNISSVVIMKDNAGVSKGFGFVGFNLHEDAKKAMEALNGAIIVAANEFTILCGTNASS
ncbi:polyadenylate-binding protein 6-like [Apium graveolens]|uniref:polyadenylate-binding protein 6-like n=1 Tax=Apium graveolens TaxID=4045 RepID=UPI003D79258E